MMTGPATEAIANADAHLSNAGLATYTEAREALADLLRLADVLSEAHQWLLIHSDRPILARARAVLSS